MYQSELDSATLKILCILGIDINTISKVKYKELEGYLNTLGMQQYMQGHDDGYSMCAGYSRK
jgi:3-deoxy-D-manno-octulosonate 8-phosphate phosphatase KdsC-like HAD superfamily phosphatase